MKIAISSQGKELESTVDQRFGRAKGFIIYDDESEDFNYIDNNQNFTAMQGAGIQAAKNMLDKDVEVLITGNVGPKAFTTLNQAGIEIIIGADGNIKNAIDNYKSGKLKKASNANVEGHW